MHSGKTAKDGSEGPALGARGAFEWTTGRAPDNTAPRRWRGRPKVGPGHYARYGCGPESLVKVYVAARDPSTGPLEGG